MDSSTTMNYWYLAMEISTLHQELSGLLLILMRVYQVSQNTVQARMTTSKQGIILRLW